MITVPSPLEDLRIYRSARANSRETTDSTIVWFKEVKRHTALSPLPTMSVSSMDVDEQQREDSDDFGDFDVSVQPHPPASAPHHRICTHTSAE